MHHYGHDNTEERLSRARAAVDNALGLQPELPEAHLAFAYYHYWGYRDYERALEELAIAERGLRNDSRVLMATAAVLRRQGEFEAAVDRLKAAFELSPQDALLPYEIAVTFRFLRRYAEADPYLDLSISLAPDKKIGYQLKAANYVAWLGDTKRAREVLESMPGEDDDALDLWRYEQDYEAVLDLASSVSEPIIRRQFSVFLPALTAARAHRLMGESELAYASYDSARAILETELDAHPDDCRIHSALGIAYAGLGNKQEAIREGKRGLELCPVSRDALTGAFRVWHLAEIYTMVGGYDEALDQIDYVLSIPNVWSVNNLRLDPIWDPLRDHQRYRALLEKYAID
jgi:serine/threonine-protein kinase